MIHERFCCNRGFAALENGVAGFSFLVSCCQETRSEHLTLETRNPKHSPLECDFVTNGHKSGGLPTTLRTA